MKTRYYARSTSHSNLHDAVRNSTSQLDAKMLKVKTRTEKKENEAKAVARPVLALRKTPENSARTEKDDAESLFHSLGDHTTNAGADAICCGGPVGVERLQSRVVPP